MRQKILIIDDNKGDIQLIKDLFVEAGVNCEILWAESAKLGLEIAKKESPEMVFLDTLMPEIGGFEACEQLRRFGSPQTYIVMMSGTLGMDNEVLAKKYGANSFCIKTPKSILEAVLKYIGQMVYSNGAEPKINVLLVEDNEGDRLLFKEALNETGLSYNLMECHSVAQAIIKVQTERPDIIFMDIMMPVINGADYVKSLKNDPNLKSTPVVFLTGMLEGSKKKELNIGGLLFPAMGKPVNASDLKDSIQKSRR